MNLGAFFLREAVISLWRADVAGNPILTQPVWCGDVANGLRLTEDWEETRSFSSGDAYKTAHHEDEEHRIEIERTWRVRVQSPGGASGPQRGERYVMEILWFDARARLWHKRTYYGVTGLSAGLDSDGPRQHNQRQVFRAQRYTQTGGSELYTPLPQAEKQLVGFFCEQPLIPGEYLLGHYRWNRSFRATRLLYACWPPSSDTILGLEVGGLPTGVQITIPSGTANQDTVGEMPVDVVLPAGAMVRWKVISGPEIGEAAWHLALVVEMEEL